jgi:hypothetical protein
VEFRNVHIEKKYQKEYDCFDCPEIVFLGLPIIYVEIESLIIARRAKNK